MSEAVDNYYAGETRIWDQKWKRALRTKHGQEVLQGLESALLAMPRKRLLCGVASAGVDTCAVECYARYQGLPTASFIDIEDRGRDAKISDTIVVKLVDLNDVTYDEYNYTPEERYEHVLAWVRQHIRR